MNERKRQTERKKERDRQNERKKEIDRMKERREKERGGERERIQMYVGATQN